MDKSVGLEDITEKHIDDLNKNLIPKLKFPHILWATINLTPKNLLQEIKWKFSFDENEHINGCFFVNPRDIINWNCFGDPKAVDELLTESIKFSKDDRVEMQGTDAFTHFWRVPAELADVVRNFIVKNGKKIVTDRQYDAWTLKDESKMNNVIKTTANDVQFESLKISDVDYVDKFWTYRSTSSINMLTECIKCRPSICVRGKFHKEDETELVKFEQYKDEVVPVTWATVRSDYSIGTVYTLPSYRGKGLAKKAMAIISSQFISQANSTIVKPFSFLSPTNDTSIHMHTQLGYEFAHPFFYIKA